MQHDIDEATRALSVGYAVLDEAEINRDFAVTLRRVLDAHILDAQERKQLGLPPLSTAAVLPFKAPDEEG